MSCCVASLRHLAISACTWSVNASTLIARGIAPCLARNASASGVVMTALIPALIFSTTSGGVPEAVKTPHQMSNTASSSPSSTTVGTSGNALERVSLVTASGFTVPACTLERSEEHTSELQSLMRTSYAVFCLKKKNNTQQQKSDQKI